MKGFAVIPILLFFIPLLASCAEKEVFIVYFGEHSGEKALHEIQDTHHSYLLSVKKTEEEARDSLLYSYKHSINGFAALLTSEEASKLSELEEVVSVFPSHPGKYSLQTTRSWEFLGLTVGDGHQNSLNPGEELLAKARYGKNVIVGLLDSGIWPESKSFSDGGMGPVPKSWKGICQTGVAFNSSNCNRKIIGARYYLKGYENYYGPLNASEDYRSPRDGDGHGTHTTSTVGSRRVRKAAAIGGFARGTASGGAPLVHLAIYKACWAVPSQSKANGNTCFEEDMLAALDDAINDGVHVLSISIGTDKPYPFFNDAIAIGSFHALKNNIVVACSAGNAGPAPSTLSNLAPWMITVAASTVDREFISPVILGNFTRIEGQSVAPLKLKKKKQYPLVYAAAVVNPGVPKNVTNQCLPGSLSPEKVKGKIVLCVRGAGTRVGKGLEVKRAGGAGFILGNNKAYGAELVCDSHMIPATSVTYNDVIRILNYINSTINPTATIIAGKTVIYTKPAPIMASFSSRGPNAIDHNILKPDITAPGVNILAAWSEGDPPTKTTLDPRIVKFNFESGTSMACPHVAAGAALLKAIHPSWSSAAIRSALMTTAVMTNNMGLPISELTGRVATPFAYGSGHFHPTAAADPGLVYDASYTDYLLYLCSSGPVKFLDPTFECPSVSPPATDLNHPSLAIPKLRGSVTVNRTVTNVGNSTSVYFFTSIPPLGFSIMASPSTLFFDHVGQTRSFSLNVSVINESLIDRGEYTFGWYTWSDGPHVVRSPVAVSLG